MPRLTTFDRANPYCKVLIRETFVFSLVDRRAASSMATRLHPSRTRGPFVFAKHQFESLEPDSSHFGKSGIAEGRIDEDCAGHRRVLCRTGLPSRLDVGAKSRRRLGISARPRQRDRTYELGRPGNVRPESGTSAEPKETQRSAFSAAGAALRRFVGRRCGRGNRDLCHFTRVPGTTGHRRCNARA